MESEIASFQTLAEALETHASPETRGFMTGLRSWMSGYQDWVDLDTRR